MGITQDGRICTISTPLGKDVLLLRSLDGREEISRPFRYRLELVSPDEALDLAELIGQSVTLTLDLPDGKQRFINGLVSRFAQTGQARRMTIYQVEVVPWLWRLTRRTDCRIFQNQAVPDIVEKVFNDRGLTDFEFRLEGSYEPLVNCVQYRETDFAFVSRLLEEEGIFYFFEHQDGVHQLILADAPGKNPEVPEQAVARYHPGDRGAHAEDLVEEWQVEQVLQPGGYALNDFNFMDPSTGLLVSASSAVSAGNNDELEVYDYPGAYVNLGGEEDAKLEKGEARIKLRTQEGDARTLVATGAGGCRAFLVGHRFDLDGHFRDDQNTTHLLTSVRHRLTQEEGFESGKGSTSSYENTFVCIPHATVFRPPRLTPKPKVAGPQTAIVVGPSGEEIYVDKHGRVKVQFHWDREGQRDENSSCWIRVAQNWAGKQWGMIFHPRLGQEVVVDFLEGNPDRPLITGRVYNAEQPIPYDVPTQSGVKSRSSKEGSSGNFNEIRFEDKKGSEVLTIHAEKDESITVENDKSESVGHDETVSIGNDRTETVGNDQSITVGNNETYQVGSNRDDTVGGNVSRTVGGNRTRKVGGNETVTIGAARTHTVGINEAITIGAAQEVSVGAIRTVTVGANQSVNIGADLSENVGANLSQSVGKDGSINIGKKLAIVAGDEITLKTGKAQIVMKKDGTVQIQGKDITVKGSGKINVKASKDIVLKGKKILEN